MNYLSYLHSWNTSNQHFLIKYRPKKWSSINFFVRIFTPNGSDYIFHSPGEKLSRIFKSEHPRFVHKCVKTCCPKNARSTRANPAKYKRNEKKKRRRKKVARARVTCSSRKNRAYARARHVLLIFSKALSLSISGVQCARTQTSVLAAKGCGSRSSIIRIHQSWHTRSGTTNVSRNLSTLGATMNAMKWRATPIKSVFSCFLLSSLSSSSTSNVYRRRAPALGDATRGPELFELFARASGRTGDGAGPVNFPRHPRLGDINTGGSRAQQVSSCPLIAVNIVSYALRWETFARLWCKI